MKSAISLLCNVRKQFHLPIQKGRKDAQEPSFYCILCNHHLLFQDLVNGSACPYCDKPFFLKIIGK